MVDIVAVLIYSNLYLGLCRSFPGEPWLSLIASPSAGAVAMSRHLYGATFGERSSWLLFLRRRRYTIERSKRSTSCLLPASRNFRNCTARAKGGGFGSTNNNSPSSFA
nr:hypothetical protein Iba_scaffold48729CG0010 [Ipomoea batatas]GMD97391.1 hypothetical protein Iba_chr15cCG2160 [Ipomoea batatas]